MTVSDLSSTELGVQKHHTTSTVVKTEFCHVPGPETCLHNLHRITTGVKITLPDLPSTETRLHEHCTTSTVVEIGREDISGTQTHQYNLQNSKNDLI